MTVDIDFNLGYTERPGLLTGPTSTWHVRISKAPHILVAGMTGGGKSVFVHKLITQVLFNNTPNEVRLLLIDPKRIEFGRYKGVPHLVADPAYEAQRIENLLVWAVTEMQMRFDFMEQSGMTDITSQGRWPRLLIFIDELANLIIGNKKMEKPIVEIASMGRAAGVHLILATQRPSADVITGLIRANVPTRVCMPVITKMDSRIVLDVPGGETLEKPGDMLIRLPGRREVVRGFGQNVTDHDIDNAVATAMALR
jgi:S-DNA-T family DNA segregation ATPase FtsK/SpoIIIE